jgi:hypothetical protein
LFRPDQTGGAETLCKAIVGGLEAGNGIDESMLIAQQPGEALRNAKLTTQRLLPVCPV